MTSIAVVFGTRPEAIKLAPLIRLLRHDPNVSLSVVNTGQHGGMLQESLRSLEVTPDHELGILKPGQDLASLTSRVIVKMSDWMKNAQIDKLVVHGDTTTAAGSAVAAFYQGKHVHHVEAGLRTHNLTAPFPEEFNRQLIARIATVNYAPTQAAKLNLLNEGVASDRVIVSGNTIVESLAWIQERSNRTRSNGLNDGQGLVKLGMGWVQDATSDFGIVTLHRRENQGKNFENVLAALRESATKHPEFRFVFPVHPNPIISGVVHEFLGDCENVVLTDPMEYTEFSIALSNCKFILTDSGGIQEEAVTLGKAVILARSETERPEGITSGLVMKPDLDYRSIHVALEKLILSVADRRKSLNLTNNPFGDGNASSRIASCLLGAENVEEFRFG